MEVTMIAACTGVVAALSGMILGWSAKTREERRYAVQHANADASLRTDVEYIKRGVDEIRVEQKAQAQRLDHLSERVTRMEESVSQAHNRLNGIDRRKQQTETERKK